MDRHLAIRNTHKNVGVIDGESDAWDLDGNKITIDEELVTKEIERLQADYDAKSYARARESQYPSITDVVVALAEKEEGDDTAWQEITAQRAKVKADNPKPS